ncbi:GRF-type domain-containing protein [Abeliophyllum distichum]|uniref:GRF-type domain-containing protein n=1 Tax=Abeliophyllum distichum TaxID=126358 RepID=A0ABD1TY32_9LAMI
MVMENVDGYAQINEQKMCMYGMNAAMRTWTEKNSGRRFLGCSFYGRPDACDYFKWVDLLVHPRYKSVINGLLKNANHKAALERKLHRKLIYHWILLAMVLVVLIQYVV